MGVIGGDQMTCTRCNKDHKLENTGPLTVCEREAYFAEGGAMGKTAGGEKVRGFALGQNRFQLNGK